MSGIEDLVPVRSHDELRAGMAIVAKGQEEWTAIILQAWRDEDAQVHKWEDSEEWEECLTPLVFVDTYAPDEPGCYCEVIARGELFRLHDLNNGDADSEVTERPQSLVRT